MAKNKDPMSTDDLRELLRYFVGDPIPYMQDGRYRELVQTFRDTDNRPSFDDARISQAAVEANEYDNADASNETDATTK